MEFINHNINKTLMTNPKLKYALKRVLQLITHTIFPVKLVTRDSSTQTTRVIINDKYECYFNVDKNYYNL
jgi:hypothetical protein